VAKKARDREFVFSVTEDRQLNFLKIKSVGKGKSF